MLTRPNAAMRRIEANRDAVLDLVRAHEGRSVAVFGSVARGNATQDSDIDLLVEYEPTSSLLDLIELEEDLRHLPGTNVDVISAEALLERDTEIRRDAVPPSVTGPTARCTTRRVGGTLLVCRRRSPAIR